MRWTATIIDGHEDAVHIVHEGAVLHRLTRIEARALAAELVRVADEGETGTEAGEHRCPNCHKRRDFIPVLDDHNGDTGTLECDECGWIIEAPKENTHV